MTDAPALRGYQPLALTEITRHLARGGRGQLRAACGTGKTLVALRASEKLVPKAGLTVVLAPSIGLVAQTLDAWIRDSAVPFTESAVCSDDTVNGNGERVSTDPEMIAGWMRHRGRKVIASTYASAPALAQAARDSGTVIDLLVCDEAHRLAGRADKDAAVVLDTGTCPARRRLFLTATPRLCYSEDSPGLSMDDEDLFGPVLYDYSFAAAIADGWLDDYRVAVIGVTDEVVRALLDDDPDTEYIDSASGLALPVLAAQIALARAARDYGIRRAVTFHSRIAAAQEFSRTFRSTIARLPADQHPPGTCSAFSVNGSMTSVQRESILDHLRHPPEGGWSVVANARCLGEGIDIPAIDAVLFASPRESVTDIAQAAGRALRRHEGGTGVATIIVPVVVAASGEISDLDSGAYSTVWRVVSAMREHDEALATNLNFARTHWARNYPAQPRGEPALPGRITVTVPGDMGGRLAAALSLAIIQHASSPWWDGYAHAADFHAEHHHLAVPNTHACADGFHLGHWIGHNRQYHRQGVLAPDRVEALEKIGMIWDAHDAKWETFYHAAAAYHAEHGALLVRADYVTPEGLRLGHWIKTQRQQRGRAPERTERLDAIGMVWKAPKGPRNGQWQDGYEGGNRGLVYARAYRQQFGDLNVPQRYKAPDGYRIGSWINRMRAAKKTGNIDPALASELDSLGMRWQIRASPGEKTA